MDFSLTSDQEMLKALVERFIADRHPAPPRATDPDGRSDYRARNWTLLAEMGLLGLPFAEALGGAAAGEEEIATVMEAFGRGLAGEGFLDEIIVAGRLIEAAGTDGVRQSWIPRIVSGEAHLALAHAEHTARFDLARCRMHFADGRLTGAKTCAPVADAYLVTAVGEHGPGLFLADAAVSGLERRAYRLVDGLPVNELQFDAVPAEPLPGGFAALEQVVQTARMAACAEMLGLMGLLLEATLAHVRERRQFGVPIGQFQAIQHRLADLYVSGELSRSQLYRCLLSPAAERPAAVAAAKSYISTSAVKLGEECIQFHGGMGVSDELPIGHAHKRILVLASAFGDADYEQARYNRLLLSG